MPERVGLIFAWSPLTVSALMIGWQNRLGFALIVFGVPLAQATDAAGHWAFQPIANPAIPSVKDRAWLSSPVDHFILSKLEANGLTPSPRADAWTLLRRASLDLIGLPPTRDEVASFEAEADTDLAGALARWVDRLLASPAYGERWGRHWLDIARYADNKGYVFFEEKDFPWAWTYRDYVICSLNDDKPFDQFIVEQLAADQLELAGDKTPLTALGFLTLGPRFSGNIHDILDDRIDVTTRGLMGLTVTCARCHDHKYDPIPTTDYYSLYGVFRSASEPTLQPVFQPVPDTEERRAFDAELKKRLKELNGFVTKTRENIINSARTRTVEYLAAVHAKRNQPSTENFMLLTDKGAINPYVIHRWEMFLKTARRERDPIWTVWHRFSALSGDDFAAHAPAVHRELFSTPAAPPMNTRVRTAFAAAPPKSMKEIIDGYGKLFKTVDAEWIEQCDESECLIDNDAETLRLVLYGQNSPPMIPRRLGWGFLALIPDRPDQAVYKELIKAVEQWSMTGKGAPPRAMVLTDIAPPYEPVVFTRGNPHQRGEPVPRQFLAALTSGKPQPFQNGSGRLELARAIASPDNPLTARVIVNRVWAWHFGSGLVTTPSDFGTRSQPPSHPKLLDWLATDFIENGWSLKHLHRQIMTSATWQMASTHPREKSKSKILNPKITDAENRLLWKFNRKRLGYGTMRDTLVTATGQLNSLIGGPPVNVLGTFNPRRSIYGRIDRMDVDPTLRAFDFPDPNLTCARREVTTVSPQALYLMNNATIADYAKRIATRNELPPEKKAKVKQLYEILFSREPGLDEIALANNYLGKKPGKAKWQNFVHALILTNEFSFVD